MAKLCPETNEPVVYLTCGDCEQKRYCKPKRYNKQEEEKKNLEEAECELERK